MQERCGASRKNNLPAYLSQHTAAAWLSSVELDRNDMADYTDTTRRWCCSALLLALKRPQVPRVGRLARGFLSMAPSSALALPPSSLERIFSLCNHMFGDAQLSALTTDYVQGSLMLRANKHFH